MCALPVTVGSSGSSSRLSVSVGSVTTLETKHTFAHMGSRINMFVRKLRVGDGCLGLILCSMTR